MNTNFGRYLCLHFSIKFQTNRQKLESFRTLLQCVASKTFLFNENFTDLDELGTNNIGVLKIGINIPIGITIEGFNETQQCSSLSKL